MFVRVSIISRVVIINSNRKSWSLSVLEGIQTPMLWIKFLELFLSLKGEKIPLELLRLQFSLFRLPLKPEI